MNNLEAGYFSYAESCACMTGYTEVVRFRKTSSPECGTSTGHKSVWGENGLPWNADPAQISSKPVSGQPIDGDS